MLTSQEYEALAADLTQAIMVAAHGTKLDAKITGPAVDNLKFVIKKLICVLDH